MPSRRLTDAAIRKYRAEPGDRREYWDTVQSGLHLRVSCDQRRTRKGQQRRVWYVRYRVNCHQRRQRLGEFPGVSVKTARERAEKVMAKVHDDRDPQAERKLDKVAAERAKDWTVARLVEDFLAYQEEQGVKSRFEQERMLRKDALPILGEMAVSDVSPADVDRVVRRVKRRGQRTGAKRGGLVCANRVKSLLVQLFNFAAEEETWRPMVRGNPAALVRRPLKFEQRKTARDRFLSDDELRRLWQAADSLRSPRVAAAYRFRLATGQRQTEILGLRWDELQREQVKGTGEEVLVWHLPAHRTKTSAPHTLPLPHLAEQILESLRPTTSTSEFVFESPRRPGSPLGRLNRSFRKWKREAKVEDFVGTDIRRTVNTGLARLGVRHEIKKAILNHRPDDVNRAHYDRYDYFEEKLMALRLWTEHLDRVLTGELQQARVVNIKDARSQR